jgi:hypothetical protein
MRRVSKQAALFCKKAHKKLHSPCNLGRAERAESQSADDETARIAGYTATMTPHDDDDDDAPPAVAGQ